MNRIGIIDYGMGNLHSVENALRYIGADCFISDDKAELSRASALILPGVGAFPDAIERLKGLGFPEFIKSETEKKPLLGICLGMQLLFEKSYEFRECEGLGFIKGEVVKLKAGQTDKTYKIPHIGYNGIHTVNPSPLLKGIDDGACFYFVHSYMGQCADRDQLIAVTEYGEDVTAIVADGNVYGTQFHPEKSGDNGLALLKNFKEMI
jgi:glutamine amidotransferase